MKITKRMTMLLACLMLLTNSTGFASEPKSQIATRVDKKHLISTIENVGAKSISENGTSLLNIEQELNANVREGETVVYHNDGNPMNTDIFVDKQGNELFAIIAKNENGEINNSYYISDTDSLMDTQLDEIVKDVSSRAISKPYNWVFHRSLAGGKKEKVGSMKMEMTSSKTSTTVASKAASVWDLVARTEIHATGYADRINSSIVRMSVASGSQKLHDYQPETTSNIKFSVSLSDIIKPYNWTIDAGGYTIKDLAQTTANRYGRWQFNARVGSQKYWVIRPGIRASNSIGTFYTEYSQTIKYNFSEHQTGIVKLSYADR